MSVNPYLHHVFVLPEDDANSRIATGFHLEVDCIRQMQVLEVAGGWLNVSNLFDATHVSEMRRWGNRLMVLLIDFDDHEDRLEQVKRRIPADVADRVFILGVLSDPEALKTAFHSSCEAIGASLAKECRDGTNVKWNHRLLRHNNTEVDRLRDRVLPILFG